MVVLLGLFWFLLSGRVGLQYAVFLVASVGLVLWLNPERPFPGLEPTRGGGFVGLARAIPRLVQYAVWLVWNVVLANIDVARLILHPRMPIDPQLITFRTKLRDPLARVLVANSITLTPGTVTIDLQGRQYLVHALTRKSASAIESGGLQNIVGSVFDEEADPAPTVHVIESLDEFDS